MRQIVYDGDVKTGTITDVSPYSSMTNSGVKVENRKAAVSAVDDEGFIFMTESAAKFWLWLKYKQEAPLDSNGEIKKPSGERLKYPVEKSNATAGSALPIGWTIIIPDRGMPHYVRERKGE